MRLSSPRPLCRTSRLLGCVAAAPVALALLSGSALAQAPAAESATDTRAAALVTRMTSAEKIEMIRGVQEGPATDQGEAGYLGGIARLGIPALRMADGPPGVLTREPSIAPPATMALAATFSRADAQANGQVIAKEAQRLGVDVVLEPFINILRDTAVGRGWNTFGEDPFLSGKMGAAQVEGIQNEGVMAQAKHFVGYDNTGYNMVADDQTLHEVYLAPFQDVVDAGVSSIMCAYNKVGGQFACGSHKLLTDQLRGEMGFKGYVTSDWGGAHKPQDVTAGLDMEMPGLMPKGSPWLTITRSYFDGDKAPIAPLTMDMSVLSYVFSRAMPEDSTPATAAGGSARAAAMHGQFPDDPAPINMATALSRGLVSQKAVDQAAYRVLHEMNRFGYLDGKTHQPTHLAPAPESEAIIAKTARDAAVLLKNEGGILPLAPSDMDGLALVGPGANQVVALGINAEHSLGIVATQRGTVDVLKDRHPGKDIAFAVANDMTGTPIPASAWGEGLTRYRDGKPVSRDAALDFTATSGKALPADSMLSWKGELTVPAAGTYGLYLQVLGSNAELIVDGKPLSHTASMTGARHGDTVQAGQDNLLPTTDGLDNVRRDVALSAGRHSIELRTFSDTSHAPVQVRLAWMTPEQKAANVHEAVEKAASAKKAVVFVWVRQSPVFGIPGDQNALVEAIAARNPNTIVVLNTSLPVAMPWLSKVKGVVNMWWPGDKGGEATADILEGRASPAGRLPFTWGEALADYPTHDPAHPERSKPAADGAVVYSEGIDVGYRGFERKGVKPLYSFGYGLSYSHFDYAGLKVSPAGDGGLDTSFTVTNSGKMASDEVAQVYLGAPQSSPAPVAIKALAGFDRITLAPGESRMVTVHVPARSLQYWNSSAHAWTFVPGERPVLVGGSSQDIRLSAKVSKR